VPKWGYLHLAPFKPRTCILPSRRDGKMQVLGLKGARCGAIYILVKNF